MESSSKRRKLDHSSAGLQHKGLINFEARESTRVSTASTFVLQTDELLKTAKLDYGSAFKGVDAQLHQIKGIIDSIEPHDPVLLADATARLEKKHRIVVPYPDPRPPKEAPYKLSYAKPAQCNVVGSYVSRTMIKSQPHRAVDMIVQMPRELFQEKDYANMRYFYRRAYYLAYIAAHVRDAMGDSCSLEFEQLRENPLLPVLVIRPLATPSETNGKSSKTKKGSKSGAHESHITRIIPCAPEDLFPRSKLNPGSSNNRSAGTEDKTSTPTATPYYNATLQAEGSFVQYLRVLTYSKNECAALPDACVLGRIWLQQRGFGTGISQGGFGHFEWAAMLSLLLQMGGRNGQPALSNSLSSAELFKAAIQFLASTDFNKKPYTFNAAKVDLEMVREQGPVMFDPVRQLNLLANMSPWSASLLQFHARATADLLADESVDNFEPTFIMKIDAPPQVYDAFFKIESPAASSPQSPDRRGSVWDFSLQAAKILKRAYGNRAQLVHFQQPESSSWPLNGSHNPQRESVLVGVIFDLVNMSRQMEHGPPAEEQKEAARFRQFWGEKSELRRFKDGSILECVEWDSRQPGDICEEIARYALKRHLKVAKDDISFIADNIAGIVDIAPTDKLAFDAGRKAFQTFEQDIRNLNDLPLEIRQLSPISSGQRYTSIEPPEVGFHQGSIHPMDVNIYFEASSRWPENLVAIQQAKIEFLLDIDKRLTAAHDNISTHLGRENRDSGVENLAYLDVIYDEGAAFRLRVHCDLEQGLLERQVQNKTLDHHVRDASEAALADFKWLYTTLPFHTQMMATFCTRLQPLSPAIRLAKAWFNSHKLTGHISEELIELIVLHVFLQPYPWRIPSSGKMGFLRTLSFLSRWDWRDEPLIVDSAETLTAEDRFEIRKDLESWRARDPNMNHAAFFVATSSDTSGLAYTRDGPSKLIASRMTRLAKAATKLIKDEGINLHIPELFRTSLQDYDVLFHLSSKSVKAATRAATTNMSAKKLSSHYKNISNPGAAPLPIRASPVDVLIEELSHVYEDTLIFFHGGSSHSSGNEDDLVIAAIWNPRLQRQKFRAGLPYNFARVQQQQKKQDKEADDVVEVNRNAVLLEIARIGGEMIKQIEIVDDEEEEDESE